MAKQEVVAGPTKLAESAPAQLNEDWDAFLASWPAEKVRAMTLSEYCRFETGFCYALETKYKQLGGIGGGSAFKFGIYERADTAPKEPSRGLIWGDKYAWASKYGETADAAWKTVHAGVIEVVDAAQAADYDAIEGLPLWPVVKWKIAFLYQNQGKPGILPVYRRASLVKAVELLLGKTDLRDASFPALYRALLDKFGSADLMSVGKMVWRATLETAPERDPDGSDDNGEVHSPASTGRALNQILFGPPGTGKTYEVVRVAVDICDGQLPDDDAQVRERFNALRETGRIEMVTFHQSYGYEDFVEGLRPVLESEDAGSVRYEIHEGVFRRICRSALSSGQAASGKPSKALSDIGDAQVWKMSLGDTQGSEEWVYEDCIKQGRIRLNYGFGLDYGASTTRDAVQDSIETVAQPDDSPYHCTAVHAFRNRMQEGDLVVVTDGNRLFRAVGRITGDYQWLESEEEYAQARDVEWLRVFETSQPYQAMCSRQFTQPTIYSLDGNIKREALQQLLGAGGVDAPQPHVLIIDEINRGNIAKIFGELITLLEDDKRRGAENALSVRLPQSDDWFDVPSNVYVLGTMNTADRSIAFLDSALRRRFRFRERMPDSAVVRDVVGMSQGGEDLGSLAGTLLDVMNKRIEVLFDRDHQIGHAYFLRATSLESLRSILVGRIIPLLQEYFYGDWGKVCQVLGLPDPAEAQALPKDGVLSFELLDHGLGDDHEQRYRVRVSQQFEAAKEEELRPFLERIIKGTS
jgi:5-methylcytosine-specific restriction protein B